MKHRRLKLLLIAIPTILVVLVAVVLLMPKHPPLEPAWTVSLGDVEVFDMQVDPAGDRVYLLTEGLNVQLTCYSPTGEILWSWNSSDYDYMRQIRFNHGRIYLYGYHCIVALDPLGNELWSYSLDRDPEPEEVFGVGMTADFVTALGSTLFGFDQDGNVVWAVPSLNRLTGTFGWREETVDGLWVGAAGFQAIAHHPDGTVAWGPMGQRVEFAVFIPYPDGSVCRVQDWEYCHDMDYITGLEWHEPDGSSRFYLPGFSVHNRATAPDGGIYYPDVIANPTSGRNSYNACMLYPDNTRRVLNSGRSCPQEVRYLADGALVYLNQSRYATEAEAMMARLGVGHNLRYRIFNRPEDDQKRCSIDVYRASQPVQESYIDLRTRFWIHHWLVIDDILVLCNDQSHERKDEQLLAYRIPEK